MVSAKRAATYQDVLDAPEHMIAELIGGELHLQPRPAKRHALSATRLGSTLESAFGRRSSGAGGWVILFEPEIHFGADVLVPDIAGWQRSDVPELDLEGAFFEEVPAWICEVLSPRTERIDRIEKLETYGREGVRWVWFVSPLNQTLEVLRLVEGKWLRVGAFGDDAVVRVEPFEAADVRLTELWNL
jgi:Uma2 family endonuclease